MRELAIQSANTTNSTSDRTALQAEVSALTTELNRISSTTEFNNVKLLDGNFTNKNFQVGTGADDSISVSIANSAATAIGVHRSLQQTALITRASRQFLQQLLLQLVRLILLKHRL